MPAPIRVLCVDDEPSIRVMLPAVLQHNGYEVTATATVAEALSEISVHPYDVLIADLNIGQPGDGFTVVSAMRRTQPGCVNFILTGYPAFETALQALRSQVDDYLVKPADIPHMLALIEQRLKSRPEARKLAADRRVSQVLREQVFEITQRTLELMKAEPALALLPLSDEQRIKNIPRVVEQLAQMLESSQPGTAESGMHKAVACLGKEEFKHGYSIPLLAIHIRLLERAIYGVISENLLALNLSYLMRDLERLNESLSIQLEATLKSYLDAAGVA